MGREETDRFRTRLQSLASRLRGQVSGLVDEALRGSGGEASGGLSNTPIHLADLASDTYEQETSLGLLEQQGETLQAVAAALWRIEEGTYGSCQECGKAITTGRLEAVPYTPHCIDCAHEMQDHGPLIGSRGNL